MVARECLEDGGAEEKWELVPRADARYEKW